MGASVSGVLCWARMLLTAVAFVVINTPAFSQSVGVSDSAFIKIEVTGTVERVPDVAVVQLGVTGDGPEKDAALKVHYENVLRILSAIRAAGVPAKDIEQQRPYVAPLHETWIEDNWSYEGAQIGFRASTQITLKLRDIPHAGSVIQAVMRSGATYIKSISFELTDDNQAKANADARANAIAKAERLAISAVKANGAARVEFVSAAPPPPPDGVADMAPPPPEPAEGGVPLVIEPGIMEITETVQVVFRVLK